MKNIPSAILCLCVALSAMVSAVSAEEPQNLASVGSPIVSVTEPQGGGSKDIGVITDGVAPAAGGTDVSLQYDTFVGAV